MKTTAVDEIAISVGIATRNRRALSLRALESVAGQLGPDDELLVVDTGSSDGTYEAVGAWLAEHFPRGRLLLDEGAGVSRARNALLGAATRPYVAFLDDDARAGEGWVDSIKQSWHEAPPRVAAVGGPIPADWGAPRPAWLRDYFLYIVSILDLGRGRLVLDQRPGIGFVWGGNMAVRIDAIREVGAFDERIGSRPEAPMDRGEDQELQLRLAARGYEIWYEPSIVAHHYVPVERLSEEYFAAQLRARARSEAREIGGALRVVERFLRASARYAVAHLGGGRSDRAVARLELIYGWNLLRTLAARS